MIFRPVLAVLGCALTVSAFTAPAAHAADPVVCTVTGTSPEVLTLGITAEQVQFGVSTDCAGSYPVSWNLRSDIYPGSSGASWLLLRNYHYPFGEKFTRVENVDGYYTVNFIGSGTFKGNSMAGPHPLDAGAFYDADGDGVQDVTEPGSGRPGTMIAKRETTFGDSFTASPGPVSAGDEITLTATLQRANWSTAAYDGFAAPVELQFRPAGEDAYQDVAEVQGDATTVSTTVEAEQTGSWRFHYAGDDVSGAASSNAATVVVE